MHHPQMLSLIGGLALLSFTACAESLHQTQRLTQLSEAQQNGYAGVYDMGSPFYYSPGFWWSPFAYYPGFYGYGPGYRSGYYSPGYYSSGSSSSVGGSSGSSSPPANAPPQFFKR